MLRLSIIMPTYNVEKYINRCITSLFKQDIMESDYELIIVNDCTPDKTMDIAKEYKNQHSNIVFINHEVNKGLGASRNNGLKNASGKYVWFADTDDFIELNCLEKIMKIAETNELDVLSFNLFTQDKNLHFNHDAANIDTETAVMSGKTFLEFHYQPSTFSSCSKIYRREYLIENNLYFTEGVYWEDADLVVKAIYYSLKVKFIPDHLYYYCYNDQSISRTGSGKKYADMVKMGARKLAFARSIEAENPDLALKIKEDAAWNATTVKKILLLNAPERSNFYKLLDEPQYTDIKAEAKNPYFRFLYHYPVISSFILFFSSPFLNLIKTIKG